MQTTAAGISRRRITIILDISGSNRSLLEMLPSLFGENGEIDIDAVFVEDSSQRRAAELTFVREFCLLTTAEREFGPADLERAIALRKQRLTRTIAAAVRRPGVAHSIRSVQAAADLLQELVSASDITMFEPLRRLRQQAITLSRRPPRGRGRVVVAINDWPGARDALLTGLRLAGGDPRRVAVLVAGTAAGTGVKDITARITNMLSAAPGGIRILSEPGVQPLIQATLIEKPDALVLGATGELLESSSILALRQEVRCPICVVRPRLEIAVQGGEKNPG